MKAVIATCYESNEERVSFVYDALKKRNFDVDVITTDFSHIKKTIRNNIPEGYSYIRTVPYSKNLSINRIRSHQLFSRDLFKTIEKINPDLIWLMAPANTLIKEANSYKKRHRTKLIIDIIDMWPESLPIKISKSVFPFSIWRNIRKNNIGCADVLVTECNFYREILSKEYNGKIFTVYWGRENKTLSEKTDLSENRLSLCYIGSINNIIGTDIIKKVISNIDGKTIVHVIGEGENTEAFISELKQVCEVIYHGAIRDEEKKSEIFSKCHAGINIYKEGLYIGLTVKCIDYFEHGLPIINNIKSDTWDFVEKYKAGINVDENTEISSQMLKEMRKNNRNIYELFENNFTKEIFEKKCLEVIDEVMK